MKTLGQIKSVANKIRFSSSRGIFALYRLIFEKNGDRTSRKLLRAFHGFDFDDTSKAFRAKLAYSTVFSLTDLMLMCDILGLDPMGSKEEMQQKIIRALIDIKSLVPHEDDDDDDEKAEEEQQSEKAEVTSELQQRMEKLADKWIRLNNLSHYLDMVDDTSSVSSTDSEDSDRTSSKHGRRNIEDDEIKITFSFKDVEDIIRPFDRSDYYPLEKWI